MEEKRLPEVSIYTDGACKGNPGPGGWAAILVHDGHEKEIGGFAPETTNNRMELTAVIEGLRALKTRCRVTVYADSGYIVNCFHQGWLEKWKQHGWHRGPKKKEPVLNVDLWQALDAEIQKHEVRFKKVEAHSGHHYNERVDQLANLHIKEGRARM